MVLSSCKVKSLYNHLCYFIRKTKSCQVFLLYIRYFFLFLKTEKKRTPQIHEMPASSIFSAYLSFCIRQTVCALIHCWVSFMCAYLNGFQCAVIFCVVVMSAIVNGTSD